MIDPSNIAGLFRLKGMPLSVESHGKGHIHDTYLVQTDQSRAYILQKINTHVFKKPDAIQDNIIRIMDYLDGKKEALNDRVHVRMDVQYDEHGNSLVIDEENGLWRSFSFIENTYTLDRVTIPEEAFAGARAFGLFVSMLEDYDPQRLHITIPQFLDIEMRLAKLEYAWKHVKERKKRATPAYRTISRHRNIADQYTRILEALPNRVTHNDAKISNILFEHPEGERSYVIDLDTVMPGTMLTDFGDMVRTFTVRGTEDTIELELNRCEEVLFEGLVAGFAEAMRDSITELETSNLLLGAMVMVYMQAIRFLTDFMDNDVYYKIAYEDQNLVRTRNQLDLLTSLLEQEMRLKEIIHKHFN